MATLEHLSVGDSVLLDEYLGGFHASHRYHHRVVVCVTDTQIAIDNWARRFSRFTGVERSDRAEYTRSRIEAWGPEAEDKLRQQEQEEQQRQRRHAALERIDRVRFRDLPVETLEKIVALLP